MAWTLDTATNTDRLETMKAQGRRDMSLAWSPRMYLAFLWWFCSIFIDTNGYYVIQDDYTIAENFTFFTVCVHTLVCQC
jgi:hypothetical protein